MAGIGESPEGGKRRQREGVGRILVLLANTVLYPSLSPHLREASFPSCSSFPREGESLVRHRRPSERNDILCHPRAGYQYASHSSQVAPGEQGPLTGHLSLQNGGSGDPASLFPQTPGEEARGRS